MNEFGSQINTPNLVAEGCEMRVLTLPIREELYWEYGSPPIHVPEALMDRRTFGRDQRLRLSECRMT